jgi:hypothetical protein
LLAGTPGVGVSRLIRATQEFGFQVHRALFLGRTPRYATLIVEILKDNARLEAGEVYGAMDMGWAKLVGQIAQAYGK